jgi:hypothetical protein
MPVPTFNSMPNEHGMETKIWRDNTKTQTAECYETITRLRFFND